MSSTADVYLLVINPGAVTLKLAIFLGHEKIVETEEPFSGGLDEVVALAGALLENRGLRISDLASAHGAGAGRDPAESPFSDIEAGHCSTKPDTGPITSKTVTVTDSGGPRRFVQ